jgi:hypothetical protein
MESHAGFRDTSAWWSVAGRRKQFWLQVGALLAALI